MEHLSEAFDKLRKELTDALVVCRVRATPRAVHRLRTAIRRIEALLIGIQKQHAQAKLLTGTIKRQMRRQRDIRRPAGGVRDYDVQLKLLRRLTSPVSKQKENGGKIADDENQLASELNAQREKAAQFLQEVLASDELRIEKGLQKINDVIPGLRSTGSPPLSLALEWARKARHKMSRLDKDTLHEFRKSIKGPRYIAELDSSPTARAFAKELHRVHDAIGYWHDCVVLAKNATSCLTRQSPLVDLIRNERQKALRNALSISSSFVLRA